MSKSKWDVAFVAGAKAERERIIKLLEETGSRLTDEKELPLWIQLAIALIKGNATERTSTALPNAQGETDVA